MIVSDMGDNNKTKQLRLTDLKTLINTTYTLATTPGINAVDLRLIDSDGVDVSTTKFKGVGNLINITTPINNQINIEALASDANFIYSGNQNVASKTWTIVHNLNKYPSVTVVDTAVQTIYGRVDYPLQSKVVITFANPIKGLAFLN
tara:strand:- start:300 stop:740 length:441 start_codon:yes stop_codon:yes gene_type:complete